MENSRYFVGKIREREDDILEEETGTSRTSQWLGPFTVIIKVSSRFL